MSNMILHNMGNIRIFPVHINMNDNEINRAFTGAPADFEPQNDYIPSDKEITLKYRDVQYSSPDEKDGDYPLSEFNTRKFKIAKVIDGPNPGDYDIAVYAYYDGPVSPIAETVG